TDITGPDTLWTAVASSRVQRQAADDAGRELLASKNWNNVADYLEDPACPNTGNGVVTEIICVVMACSLIQKIRSEAGTTA
uniref:Transposase n=1 Tax=Macrostomum lignano TaxID=282301 RepID=A0A1I8F411_9PLAT